MNKIWEVWYVTTSYENEIVERFSSEDKAFEYIKNIPDDVNYYVKGPYHVE